MNGQLRPLTVATYAGQLWIADSTLGPSSSLHGRLARIITCPLAAMLFGVGGFVNAAHLIAGKSIISKTERVETS